MTASNKPPRLSRIRWTTAFLLFALGECGGVAGLGVGVGTAHHRSAWGQDVAASRTQEQRGELPPVLPNASSAAAGQVEPSLTLAISGLPEGFELEAASSFAEGTLLTRMAGTLVRTASDDYVFFPDEGTRMSDDPLAPRAPAMILLPCQRLAQIATGMQSRGLQARGALSGQVYSYRGRAFAMPTGWAFDAGTDIATPALPVAASGGSDELAAARTRPATDVAPTPSLPANAAPGDDDPSTQDASPEKASDSAQSASRSVQVQADVAGVIKDLESAWSTRRTMSRPDRNIADLPTASQAGANADAGVTARVIAPERTLLSNVRGRLVRLADAGGRFAFAIDNDPDSPLQAGTEPLLVLPNKQLEMIEDAVGQMGDNAPFALTGRVMEYRGQRFVMPIAFRAMVGSDRLDVKPVQ